jgi:hypothetical protein
VFAAAGAGFVHSYDLETRQGRDGRELDRALTDALTRYGLADRVELHIESSRVATPPDPINLLFIDGDHSEEGAHADFERWSPHVVAGGHVLFHDAVAANDFLATFVPGPAAVVDGAGPAFERRHAAGSLAHLVRR